eukprot:6833473-Karenia_brevis.AAC.1
MARRGVAPRHAPRHPHRPNFPKEGVPPQTNQSKIATPGCPPADRSLPRGGVPSKGRALIDQCGVHIPDLSN